MDHRSFDYGKAAAVTVTLLASLFLFYLLLKYLFFALLPFFLAWGLAFIVRRLAAFLHHKIRLSERLLSLLLVLLLIALTLTAIALLGVRLFHEAEKLLLYLSENNGVVTNAYESIRGFAFGIFDRIFGDDGRAAAALDGVLSGFAESLLSTLATAVGKGIAFLPRLLFSLVVFVIAAIYFAMDLTRINAKLRGLLPSEWQSRCASLKNGAARAFLCYVRTYSLIFFVNMTVLFIGLSILGRGYALLLSFLIALFDLLPVIGIGTALIPWGIYCLATGDLFVGGGLLVLYAALTLLRQFLEPRMIGVGVGIHPLVALLATVVGLQLFGFVGALLGPIVAVAVKSILLPEKPKGEK